MSEPKRKLYVMSSECTLRDLFENTHLKTVFADSESGQKGDVILNVTLIRSVNNTNVVMLLQDEE